MWPLVAALFGLYVLVRGLAVPRGRVVVSVAAAAVAALLVSSPFLWGAWTTPGSFNGAGAGDDDLREGEPAPARLLRPRLVDAAPRRGAGRAGVRRLQPLPRRELLLALRPAGPPPALAVLFFLGSQLGALRPGPAKFLLAVWFLVGFSGVVVTVETPPAADGAGDPDARPFPGDRPRRGRPPCRGRGPEGEGRMRGPWRPRDRRRGVVVLARWTSSGASTSRRTRQSTARTRTRRTPAGPSRRRGATRGSSRSLRVSHDELGMGPPPCAGDAPRGRSLSRRHASAAAPGEPEPRVPRLSAAVLLPAAPQELYPGGVETRVEKPHNGFMYTVYRSRRRLEGAPGVLATPAKGTPATVASFGAVRGRLRGRRLEREPPGPALLELRVPRGAGAGAAPRGRRPGRERPRGTASGEAVKAVSRGEHFVVLEERRPAAGTRGGVGRGRRDRGVHGRASGWSRFPGPA